MTMSKTKLKLLYELLGELLQDERRQFTKDTGIEPDSDEYARLARRYLGRPLPRLGEVRDEPETDRRRTKHVRDSAQDAAANFERNCRELRLKLQRGEK